MRKSVHLVGHSHVHQEY